MRDRGDSITPRDAPRDAEERLELHHGCPTSLVSSLRPSFHAVWNVYGPPKRATAVPSDMPVSVMRALPALLAARAMPKSATRAQPSWSM
ncbi:MAG: hypothetical protein M3545_11800 [Acidobacteriota bacterium]|nr:hypothetical protein [Acidobacteriota bacterium]